MYLCIHAWWIMNVLTYVGTESLQDDLNDKCVQRNFIHFLLYMKYISTSEFLVRDYPKQNYGKLQTSFSAKR